MMQSTISRRRIELLCPAQLHHRAIRITNTTQFNTSHNHGRRRRIALAFGGSKHSCARQARSAAKGSRKHQSRVSRCVIRFYSLSNHLVRRNSASSDIANSKKHCRASRPHLSLLSRSRCRTFKARCTPGGESPGQQALCGGADGDQGQHAQGIRGGIQGAGGAAAVRAPGQSQVRCVLCMRVLHDTAVAAWLHAILHDKSMHNHMHA